MTTWLISTLLPVILGVIGKALTDYLATQRTANATKEHHDAERRMREANAQPRDPDDIVDRLRRNGL